LYWLEKNRRRKIDLKIDDRLFFYFKNLKTPKTVMEMPKEDYITKKNAVKSFLNIENKRTFNSNYLYKFP